VLQGQHEQLVKASFLEGKGKNTLCHRIDQHVPTPLLITMAALVSHMILLSLLLQPRFQYHGPEGDLVFPRDQAGPTQVSVQEDSPLGPLVSVVLKPTIDAKSVTLTLLLPPITLAGKEQVEFQTVAIKSTSYGLLPRTGARLTYEVISLQGTAHAEQDLSQHTHESST
jgi:hypothetical protein